MSDINVSSSSTASAPKAFKKPLYPEILVAAIIWSIFATWISRGNHLAAASLPMKTIACFAGALGGYGFGVILNRIRLWIKPTAVFTTGGFMSLLWIKVFWTWGPQAVGIVVGWALLSGLVVG